jgi:biotin-(acetyl-CoA carboxylase) ligase
VYVGEKKIAGVLTELSGEGDRLRWIATGVGINVNNPPVYKPDELNEVNNLDKPSAAPAGSALRAISCAEITGRRLSRREGLALFLGELEKLRRAGAGELRDIWNSLAGGIGAAVALIPPDHGEERDPRRIAARGRGIFAGIDHRGRCRIRGEGGTERVYSPGRVSLIYKGAYTE